MIGRSIDCGDGDSLVTLGLMDVVCGGDIGSLETPVAVLHPVPVGSCCFITVRKPGRSAAR